jgi:HEAT repeat protein
MNIGKPEGPRAAASPAEQEAWSKYFDYLIKSLNDPDTNARLRAAQMLGENREPRAIEPLCTALFDPDVEVRKHAITALGRMGPLATEALMTAQQNPDPLVRQSATQALGQIHDARVVGSLVMAMRDPHEGVRNQAAFALNKLGTLAVEPLMAALRDPDPSLRWQAARILGGLGDARALPELERLAHEDRAQTRSTSSLVNVADAAKQAMEKIKSKK